ncbi:MAG: 50S ribosomal protein L10 [Candidatus Hydrogenedentes bacterium]|nr:50S ribosomal protein L10 [Candidatus Hydrogenedentota bacterium]
MPTPQKEAAVAEIKELISNNSIAIMTQYVGINVDQATALRKKLRETGTTFKVFKNTLSRIALRELGIEDAADMMEGPTVWAFCDDPVAPAKVLKDFAKEAPFVIMRGGILDGVPVSDAQMNELAALPSHEQLVAQVVGTIAMPLRNTVGVLSALPRNLVNALDQIRQQKEDDQAA